MPIKELLPRPNPAPPLPIPEVPPPKDGLGSNSNYILFSQCNPLTGLSVTIQVTQDIVFESASGAVNGFGFQLNAFSPLNEQSAFQQYVILLVYDFIFHDQLRGAVEIFPSSGDNLIEDMFELISLPSTTIPAGYVLQISLQNDASNNVIAATYTVTESGFFPTPGSPLHGYSGSDGSQHVNYVDTNGQVRELYAQPGRYWVNNDLTGLSANGVTPAPESALDGYWGSDNSQHVNFIGIDGHVHELSLKSGAQWVNNDLTELSGNVFVPAPGSALDGYWLTDNSQHVNFIGTDGHVHELFLKQGGLWEDNDLAVLSKFDGPNPAPGSALDGYSGTDGSQHVNFIGTDGHVRELYFHPGAQSWVNNDLTGKSGNGIAPAPGSPLDGYWLLDGTQHVNFIGTDGHVHELYFKPGAEWVNNDLAVLSKFDGPNPAPGSALHGYSGTDGSQHVNFIGTDGHVREFYFHLGAQSWVNNDLTVLSGNGVTPAPGSPLDGYWGDGNGQHVNFIGTDGHVHELYIQPGAQWVNNDLNDLVLANTTYNLPLPSTELAPIIAFELNLVGPGNSESTVLSSGAGTITYTASSSLTVLNREPSCAGGFSTAETANSIYGQLPAGPSTVLVQSFNVSTGVPMIRKQGKLRSGLNIPSGSR